MKKLISLTLCLALALSLTVAMGITAAAIPATDQYIRVGETQEIRISGTYSSAATDGNYYYFAIADGFDSSVPRTDMTVESVEQDDDEIVVTVKGVSVTDDIMDVVAKVYNGETFEWEDTVVSRAYHVSPALNETVLDLTTDSKDVTQKYNLTVSDGAYTDVTMVKVSWEITDINVTRTDNKVWSTTDLAWVDADSSTVATDGVAVFALENYSSVKMDATVSFTAESGFNPTVTYDDTTGSDGTVTLDTANGNAAYSDGTAPKGEITVTVTPSDGDFDEKDAAQSVTYGTYTVTVRKSIPTTFKLLHFFDGEAGNATVNGMNATALCQYMVNNGMIADASQFGSVLVKATYYSKLQKKFVTVSKSLSLLFDTTHQEFETVTDDTLAGDNDYTSDKTFETYFNGSFTWDGSSFVKNPE